MKKTTSYNTKTQPELEAELKALRASIQAAVAKSRMGKNSTEYRVARKNIARVLTALSAMPAIITGTNSTEVKK